MNKPKWTPGPWEADPENKYAVVAKWEDGTEVQVGFMGGSNFCGVDTMEQNRRMQREATGNRNLAISAPELYEALEEIAEHLYTRDADLARCREIARAALIKARGEQ